MKKILLVAFAIFSLSFIANFETQACPVDEDDPWIGSEWITIPMGDDCEMRIEYCYRIWGAGTSLACPDLYFQTVEFVGDCEDYKAAFDNNPANYFRFAWEHIILEENPWPIVLTALSPLCPEQSVGYWRVGFATCFSMEWEETPIMEWRGEQQGWVQVGITSQKVACTQEWESGTCIRYITYCYGENLEVEFTETNLHYGDPNCSSGCEFICE